MTTRGTGGLEVFVQTVDRVAFLNLVQRVVKRCGWICYAYCLMGTHYHLLVQTPEPNLGTGMCVLNGAYSRHFNMQHARTGALFGARFHSAMITTESHLLETARYIVLNPVRAGLCRWPWEWPWSSYGATEGRIDPPDFLDVDWVLAHFGEAERRSRYRAFVLDGIGAAPPL